MSFSRRDFFWYCAGAVSVLVIGFLVHALSGNQNSGAASTGVHAAVGSDGAAGAASGARAAGSMDEVLAQLEARLAARGGSDADWELLAQTYEFVGRQDDARLARAHRLPAGAATGGEAATADAAPTGVAANGVAANGAAISSISGEVEPSDALRAQIADGLTLFVIAKSVDSPGPPVAILRTTTGHWPLRFTLDDSNSMLPGRTLSGTRHVTVEARVSRQGAAAPQSGDYQSALIPIDPRQSKSIHILIDHVIGQGG